MKHLGRALATIGVMAGFTLISYFTEDSCMSGIGCIFCLGCIWNNA